MNNNLIIDLINQHKSFTYHNIKYLPIIGKNRYYIKYGTKSFKLSTQALLGEFK